MWRAEDNQERHLGAGGCRLDDVPAVALRIGVERLHAPAPVSLPHVPDHEERLQAALAPGAGPHSPERSAPTLASGIARGGGNQT